MKDIESRRRPLFPDPFVEPRSVPWAPGRSRGDLPHLEKPGCSYFVTFCLHDAKLRAPGMWDGSVDEVFTASEPSVVGGWCALRDPQLAEVVQKAMLHFQGQRYLLSAWCVMPSHAHAVVTPIPEFTLAQVLHSWKSFSAHRINTILGRTGAVWQREAFDHLIRHRDSFHKFVDYTERNPVAAGLARQMEDWPFSSARFKGECT